jgi:hypothetical protein
VRRHEGSYLRTSRLCGSAVEHPAREGALERDELATRVAAIGECVGVDQTRGIVIRSGNDGRSLLLHSLVAGRDINGLRPRPTLELDLGEVRMA